MTFESIQVGVDLATAISVTGAAVMYFWNSSREGKKNRAALREQYAFEKTAELIALLRDKAIEASKIFSEIDDRVVPICADIIIMDSASNWEYPYDYPEDLDTRHLISQLSDDILRPLKFHLECYPYKQILPQAQQKVIESFLEKINKYVIDKKLKRAQLDKAILNSQIRVKIHESSKLEDAYAIQSWKLFDIYLKENGVIDLEDQEDFNQMPYPLQRDAIFRKFDELDFEKKWDEKFCYLKSVQAELLKHQESWSEVPRIISEAAEELLMSHTIEH